MTEYVTYGNPVGDGTTKEELKDYDLYRTVTVSFKDGQTDATITYSPWTTNTNGDVKLDADGNVSDGTDTINVAKLTTNELQKQPGYTESFANTATGATLTDDQKAANVDVSLKIAKDANNSPIEIDRVVNYAAQKQTGYVHYVYGGIGGPEIAPEKTITGDAGTSYADQYTIPETIKATKNTDNKITDIDGNVITDNDGTFDLSNYYYSHTEDHGGGQFDYFDDNTSPDDTAYNTKGQDIWVVYTAKAKDDAANWQVTTNTNKTGFTTVVISDKNNPSNVINTFDIPDGQPGQPGQDAKIQTLIVNTDPVAATGTTAAKPATHTVYFYSGDPAKDTNGDGKITQADIKPADVLGSFKVSDGTSPVIDPTGTPTENGTVYNITENGKPAGTITIPNATAPEINSFTVDNGGAHTTYFYTGSKLTTHADGSAIGDKSPLTAADIPDGKGIGQITVNDGQGGTDTTVPEEIHSLTVKTEASGTTPAKETTYFYTGPEIPAHADKTPLTEADIPAGKEIGHVDVENGADGQTPEVHAVTVDTPAPVDKNGNATGPASHTTYFYTGDVKGSDGNVIDPKNVTYDELTAANIPTIGQVTTNDGVTPTIAVAPDPTDNKDGSFTYTLNVNGKGAGTFTVKNGTSAKAPTITTNPIKENGTTGPIVGYEIDVQNYKNDGTADGEPQKTFIASPVLTPTPKLGTDNKTAIGTTVTISTIDDSGKPTSVPFDILNGANGKDGGNGTDGQPAIKEEGGKLILYIPAGKDPSGTDIPEKDLGTVDMPSAGDKVTAERVQDTDKPGVSGVKITVTHATGDPTITYLYDGTNGKNAQTPNVRPGTDEKGNPILTFYIPADGDTPEQDLGNVPAPKDGDTISMTPIKGDTDHPNGGEQITIKHGDGSPDTVETLWNGNDGAVPTLDGGKDNGDGSTTYNFMSGGKSVGTFTVKNGKDGAPGVSPQAKNGTDINGKPAIIFYIPASGDKPEQDLGTIAAPKDGDTVTATPIKGDTTHPNGGTLLTIKHGDGSPDTTETIWNGNDGATPTLDGGKDNGDGSTTYNFMMNGQPVGTFTVKNGKDGANGQTPQVKPGVDANGKPTLTFYIPANGDTPEKDISTVPVPQNGDTITAERVKDTDVQGVGGVKITVKHINGDPDTVTYLYDGTNGTNGKNATTPSVKPGKDSNGNPVLTFYIPADGDTPEQDLGNVPEPKDGDTISMTPIKGDTDHPNGGEQITIKHGDGSPDTVETLWNGNDGATPTLDKGTPNADGSTTYNFMSNGQPVGSFTVKNGTNGTDGQPAIKEEGGKIILYIPAGKDPAGNDVPEKDLGSVDVPTAGDTVTAERVTDTDKPGVSGVKVTIKHANGDPDTITYLYDGATPEVTPSQDGKSYTISFGGKNVATIKNGEDGKTPVVAVTPNKDDAGNVISNTLTISTPGSDQPAQTVTITNGKDGKPGSVVTTKPIIDPKTQKQTGITLVIDGKDAGTVMNGADGAQGPQGEAGKTPTITPTTDGSGNPTGFIITGADGKPVTVTNGKDGATPNFVQTATGYDIMLNNTKVGEVTNGKDGATPTVTTMPVYDKNNNIIGTQMVINGLPGAKIMNGSDGISPVFTPTKDGYTITIGDKTVGTVTNGKDGATPQFTEVKDNNGKVTGYTITVDDKTVGTITNGKDGSVVTTKPVKDSDGNQIGVQLFIDGKDGGTILNGAKGDKGDQGPQGDSPVITPDVDASGNPTGTYTIKIGDKVVGQLHNGKDGATPQFNPVKDNDGNVTGYDILINNTKVGSITNGKDGATPVITQTPTTDSDGKVTGTTITITTPGSNEAPQTINVTNGKDGSTPVLTPEKDDNGNIIGYAITINGNPAGELKNGKDGSVVTTKPALDKDGNQIGVTIVIDGKDGDTILNGKDGASPVITPEKDPNGNPTGILDIVIGGKTVGTLHNGVDGKTPDFTPVKDNDGNVISYNITIDGKTVGTIKNGTDGKDGVTPVITTTPELDADKKTVIGTTITITTPGSKDAPQVINVENGKDGTNGTNGQTPSVKPVTDANGNVTSYEFFIPGPKKDGTDDQIVGTVPAPKNGKDGTDGQTPQVKPVKDADGNTISYEFFIPGPKNDGTDDQIVGTVPAPKDGKDGKDGETPTVKPHTGVDGKVDGFTYTLNGVDYTVLNGKDGKDGTDGKDGADLTVTGSTVDKDGDTIVTFSDGNNVKIPAGAAGKDGQTPQVKEVPNPDGTKSLVFYIPGANGSADQVVGTIAAPKDGTDGKDAQTPSVKEVTNNDGSKSYEFFITNPDGSVTTVGTVPAPKDGVDGKDGATPTITPNTDSDGNVIGYTLTLNGVPYVIKNGTNGKDGAALTVKSQVIDKDGNTVVTFSDGSTITVNKGKDGTNGTDGKDAQTPQVKAVVGEDGTTSYEFFVVNPDGSTKTIGTVKAPKDGINGTNGKDGKDGKDGQTPQVKEVTNPDGSKSYEFYITNPDGSTTDMGNVPAPKDGKDGETPTVTPHTDPSGNVDGYTFTIDGHDYTVKNGENGKDLTVKGYTTDKDGNTVITFSDGSTVTVDKGAKGDKGDKGDQGEAGETPNVKAVVGQDGKTSYVFYVMDQDGKEVDLGTVDAPKDGVDGKDGQTPEVKEVTNNDGSKSYVFYITNPDGSEKTVGNVPAPKDGKDGETPTVTPHTGTDGKVDGYTFTIGGHDYTVVNGQDGKDGKDGQDITVKSTGTDAKGNIVVTFSDGSNVTIPKGTDGKDGQTPQVKAVPNADGSTSYEFFITNPDGSTTTVGTVPAPKDGKDAQTPSVKEVTNNDGSKSYVFYITNPDGSTKEVGNVPAPKDGKDGETPTVSETKDPSGNVDGYVFTINGKEYTVKNGKDGKDGKDGQTPQVKEITNNDGSKSYEFFITNPDGSTKDLGEVPAPEDGQTPKVKEITNNDGSKSYEFYITNPDGSEKNMGTVDAPKDGVDGKSITVTSTTKDPEGNTVVEFSDGNKVTIDKGADGKDGKDGKDGQTPDVKAVVGQDGVTHYEFYITNPDGSTKTVGDVTAPKDGKDGETPLVQPVKDANGNTVKYEFYYINDKGQKVLLGTVDAPKNGVDGKDGETPTVAPHYDANGDVDGWTFTLDGHHYIVKNGKNGTDGVDGKDGKDGQTPQIDPSKTIVDKEAGTTTYYFINPDGSNAGSIVVPNGGGTTNGGGTGKETGTDNGTGTSTGTGNGSGININNTNNQNNGGGTDNGQGTNGSTTTNTTTTNNTTTEKTITTNPDGSTTETDTTTTTDPSGNKVVKIVTIETIPNKDGSTTTKTTTTTTTYPAPSGDNGGKTTGDNNTGSTTPAGGGNSNVNTNTNTNTNTNPGGNGGTNTNTTTPGGNGGTNTNTNTNGGNGGTNTNTTTPGGNGGTNTTTPGGNGGTNTTTPGGNGGTNTTTPGGNGGTNTTTPGGNGGTNTTTPGGNGGTNTTTPGGNGGINTTTPGGNGGTTTQTTTTTTTGTAVPGGNTGNGTGTTSTGVDGGTATTAAGDTGSATTGGDGLTTDAAGDTSSQQSAGMVPTSEAGNGGASTIHEAVAGGTATGSTATGSTNGNGLTNGNGEAAQSTLPQTDESSASTIVMLGVGMTIMEATLAYGVTRRKRHGSDDNDHESLY
ncbi:hypothetical protein [Secundilactobacillus yichangensis]|uniref:hypothetical protein n=1 Tax=Secundilactobacillus yichangensis TaxID=2799580 RepID=UPI001941F954|nr:hypothetical protein [Secundilactobacillus yichangensis]